MGEFVIPNATTAFNLFKVFCLTTFYNKTGAYVILINSLYKLLYPQKMSTGKLMFRIDFPDIKFFPTFVRMNLRTPF